MEKGIAIAAEHAFDVITAASITRQKAVPLMAVSPGFRRRSQDGCPYSQRLADTGQCFNRWRLLVEFKQTDVIPGKPASESQFLLGQPCPDPRLTDLSAYFHATDGKTLRYGSLPTKVCMNSAS